MLEKSTIFTNSKPFRRATLATLIALSLSACSDNEKSTPTSPPRDTPISLNSDNFTVMVGDQHRFDLKNVVKLHGDGWWKVVEVQDPNNLGDVSLDGRDAFKFRGVDSGITTLKYVIENEAGDTFESSILALVAPKKTDNPNNPPFVNTTVIEVKSGSEITFDLLSYAIDPDGDDLRVIETTLESDRVDVNNSTVTYKPSDFTGVETINFGVEDSFGAQAVGTVTLKSIGTEGENTAPNALNYSATVDSSKSSVFHFDLDALNLISDKDGDKISVVRVLGGQERVSITGRNTLSYTPNGFTGVDQFAYIVSDEHGLESIGSFSIVVQNTLDGLSEPSVSNISVSTHHKVPVQINLRDYVSDTDTPFEDLKITNLTHAKPPATVSMVDNIVTYTPNGGVGTDELSFIVSDGVFIKSGKIDITILGDDPHEILVEPINQVTAYETEIAFSIPSPASHDGEAYRIVSIDGATLGDVSFNGLNVTYKPHDHVSGIDTLTYTISDDHIPAHTQSSTIQMKIVGDVPRVDGAVVINTHYSNPVSVDLSQYILDKDTAIDSISISNLTDAQAPSTASVDGKILTYTPNGRIGADALTFTVSDDESSSVGRVNILSRPDAPHYIHLDNISKETEFETQTSITVPLPSGNGETYEISNITSSLLGTSVVKGNVIEYTPKSGVSGVDTLTYTVSDNHIPSHSQTASLTVKINGVPPVINPINVQTNNRESISIDLAQYITDADTPMSNLHVVNISADVPTSSFSLIGKTLTYNPNLYIGSDTINFEVTDGEFTTSGAINIQIEVAPIPPFNLIDITPSGSDSLTFSWDSITDDVDFEITKVDATGKHEVIGMVHEQVSHTIKVTNLIDIATSEFYIRAKRDGIERLSGSSKVSSEYINGLVDYIKRPSTSMFQHPFFGSDIKINKQSNTLVINDYSSGGYETVPCIYDKKGENWVLNTCLESPWTKANSRFGSSISISDDGRVISIGATGVGGSHTTNSGSSVVYRKVGDTWGAPTFVYPAGNSKSRRFGGSNSVSGDGLTVAYGGSGDARPEGGVTAGSSAPPSSGGTMISGAGVVYVFKAQGSSWVAGHRIKRPTPRRGEAFGNSVALSYDGTVLAIGSRGDESSTRGVGAADNGSGSPDSGAVLVYRFKNNTWVLESYIKASNADAGDYFGTKVSLSSDGTVLAVSAPYESSSAGGINGNQHDNSLAESGAIYIYKYANGRWAQTAYIKPSNPSADDEFGWHIKLNSDGTTLAAASTRESSASTGINGEQNDESASHSGAAYLFKFRNNSWHQVAYIKATNTDAGDYFGTLDLDGSGDTLVVGAQEEDSSATDINGEQNDNSKPESGAVYIF